MQVKRDNLLSYLWIALQYVMDRGPMVVRFLFLHNRHPLRKQSRLSNKGNG